MVGRPWLALPLVGCCILALGGCRTLESEEVSEIGPFPGSANSLTDVGERVVVGLIGGEPGALGELRLSRQEYVEVVWPELPASNPDLNVPVEYVRADIEARNRSALIRLEPQFKELAAELEDVVCHGEVQEFGTFRVHTDCWVTLRTPSGERCIQLFKDVLERGAGYKLFRYYDGVLRAVEAG